MKGFTKHFQNLFCCSYSCIISSFLFLPPDLPIYPSLLFFFFFHIYGVPSLGENCCAHSPQSLAVVLCVGWSLGGFPPPALACFTVVSPVQLKFTLFCWWDLSSGFHRKQSLTADSLICPLFRSVPWAIDVGMFHNVSIGTGPHNCILVGYGFPGWHLSVPKRSSFDETWDLYLPVGVMTNV